MSLSAIPIVEHHAYKPTSDEFARIDRVVSEVRRHREALQLDAQFQHLVPDHLEPGAALHLDDYSDIGGIEGRFNVGFLQDRARLRAAEGDLVASAWAETPGYEEYCDCVLGLGTVRWLHPVDSNMSIRLAAACWRDRNCRRALIHAFRTEGLRYLHPHMGSFAVWELADLLHRSSRQRIAVIAPPPELCRMVNSKVHFSAIVESLLGEDATPPTRSAWNRASLTTQVKELAGECAQLGIKLPDSAGSRGNVVIDAQSLQDCSNDEVFQMLGRTLKPIQWDGRHRLLIDCWETNVLSSPSVQLWIPPLDGEAPIVEGIFDQQTEGVAQRFVGVQPAQLTDSLRNDLVAKSTLLAHVFQRLGYVGRCSFDTIITGQDFEHGQVKFVECNGRWGGTSLPMTLMNRMYGDWMAHSWMTAHIEVCGLDRIAFATLLNWFTDSLFHAATGTGSLTFFTPGRMTEELAIDVLVTGPAPAAAAENSEAFVGQLQAAVAEHQHCGSHPENSGRLTSSAGHSPRQ